MQVCICNNALLSDDLQSKLFGRDSIADKKSQFWFPIFNELVRLFIKVPPQFLPLTYVFYRMVIKLRYKQVLKMLLSSC